MASKNLNLAKRSRKRSQNTWALIVLIAIIVLSEVRFDHVMIAITVGALLAFFGLFFWLNHLDKVKAEADRQARYERLCEAIAQNKRVLLRKRHQGTFLDEYDLKNDDNWQSDLHDYVQRVLPLKVNPEDLCDFPTPESRIALVEQVLDQLEAAAPENERRLWQEDEDDEVHVSLISTHGVGIAFEKECARILKEAGWKTRLTVGSGDQGVDIEAEFDGMFVVIQCKNYSAPVGNAAVQEVAAGVMHYRADRGVVVSRSSYTKAARRLAATTGVLLVDIEDLSDLAEMLEEDRNGSNTRGPGVRREEDDAIIGTLDLEIGFVEPKKRRRDR